MKQTPLLTVVIAAVVGAASAAGTAMFLAPSTPKRAQVAAADPTVKKNYDAQFDELERQNADLLMRLAALESRPAAATPLRAPVGDDGFQDEVRDWMASFEDQNGEVPEGFVASVGDALDQIRTQENQERQQRMADVQAERLEERLTELQVELGLSQYQVDELRPVLTAQNLQRAELFAGGWENLDRTTMRADMEAIREATDKALATILTPEQLEGYAQSERQNRGGFGGFGGRGGDRGGRGGGADGAGGERNRGGR